MKVAIVFAALFAVALAGVVPDSDVTVLRFDNENEGNNAYNFNLETSDGQTRSESGQLKNVGTENEAISVTGQFSYPGDNGVTYTVNYVADENGFQPTGAHLPVAPVA